MTTGTKHSEQDLHDARRAMSLSAEALWVHSWLLGPGRDRDDRYGEDAHRSAERTMRSRGWSIEQLDAYERGGLRPRELPKPEKPKAGGDSGWGSWNGVCQEILDNRDVLEALRRTVPPKSAAEVWEDASPETRARMERMVPSNAARMREAAEENRVRGPLLFQPLEDAGLVERERLFRGPATGLAQALVIAAFGVMLGCLWARFSPRTADPVRVAAREAVEAQWLLVTAPTHPTLAATRTNWAAAFNLAPE